MSINLEISSTKTKEVEFVLARNVAAENFRSQKQLNQFVSRFHMSNNFIMKKNDFQKYLLTNKSTEN